MPWFEWDQNNSGGSFVVNDKLTCRLFIEADTYEEAEGKAFGMGVYYDGCSKGMDCGCCGDRWYEGDEVKLPITYTETDYGYGFRDIPFTPTGYTKAKDWDGVEREVREYELKTVEDYAKYVSVAYGWEEPDARLFYKDGTIKEVSKEIK